MAPSREMLKDNRQIAREESFKPGGGVPSSTLLLHKLHDAWQARRSRVQKPTGSGSLSQKIGSPSHSSESKSCVGSVKEAPSTFSITETGKGPGEELQASRSRTQGSPGTTGSRSAKNGGRVGGGGKPKTKRKSRASKKPPTRTMDITPEEFLATVQKLTGGTFCSQNSDTSPSVSSAAATKMEAAQLPCADLVRPQPSRPNANGNPPEMGNAEVKAPTDPVIDASVLAQDQDQSFSFLACLNFGTSEDSGLNDMMGYTNQSNWGPWPASGVNALPTISLPSTTSSAQFTSVSPSGQAGTSPVCPSYFVPYMSYSKESGHYSESASVRISCPSEGEEENRDIINEWWS